MSEKIQLRFIQSYADAHGSFIEGRVYNLDVEHANRLYGVTVEVREGDPDYQPPIADSIAVTKRKPAKK
jgi:hypothetical protein